MPHSEIPRSQFGYQLPWAYRRFPRLSSPLDAKTSTTRSCSLDHPNPTPSPGLCLAAIPFDNHRAELFSQHVTPLSFVASNALERVSLRLGFLQHLRATNSSRRGGANSARKCLQPSNIRFSTSGCLGQAKPDSDTQPGVSSRSRFLLAEARGRIGLTLWQSSRSRFRSRLFGCSVKGW